uniref:Uncharacterized protein n=1 Tax=Thermosporothrix sp. COM3 TaxID=2490863 RepID=A0A455SE98_9CHLR|nr:hypothetical protein KTC_15340 [Thermosporothrix sp. COM3]
MSKHTQTEPEARKPATPRYRLWLCIVGLVAFLLPQLLLPGGLLQRLILSPFSSGGFGFIPGVMLPEAQYQIPLLLLAALCMMVVWQRTVHRPGRKPGARRGAIAGLWTGLLIPLIFTIASLLFYIITTPQNASTNTSIQMLFWILLLVIPPSMVVFALAGAVLGLLEQRFH